MKLRSHFHLLLGVVLVFLPLMALSQSHEERAAVPQRSSAQSPTNTMQSGSLAQPTNDRTNGTVAASDKTFMREAAEGGLAEVEFGKLATEKASSQEVKSFGQRMVQDHSKANTELKEIASTKGVDLPDKLSAKDNMLKERLSKLDGASFDRAYMQNMVKDHKKDVADFNRESSNGKDSQVKDFAAKTLPTLQEHLKQAEQIAPAGKKSSTGGSH